MQVSPRLPAGLRRTTETAPSLTLGAGETEATVTVPLHADVAGEFTLPAPTVSLTDTFELYTEQLSWPAAETHSAPTDADSSHWQGWKAVWKRVW